MEEGGFRRVRVEDYCAGEGGSLDVYWIGGGGACVLGLEEGVQQWIGQNHGGVGNVLLVASSVGHKLKDSSSSSSSFVVGGDQEVLRSG